MVSVPGPGSGPGTRLSSSRADSAHAGYKGPLRLAAWDMHAQANTTLRRDALIPLPGQVVLGRRHERCEASAEPSQPRGVHQARNQTVGTSPPPLTRHFTGGPSRTSSQNQGGLQVPGRRDIVTRFGHGIQSTASGERASPLRCAAARRYPSQRLSHSMKGTPPDYATCMGGELIAPPPQEGGTSFPWGLRRHERMFYTRGLQDICCTIAEVQFHRPDIGGQQSSPRKEVPHMSIYNIGQKPGKGRYCCIKGHWSVVLDDDSDTLPPCGRCGKGQNTRYRSC